MSDQLLLLLTRSSSPDEWDEWKFDKPAARFALLARGEVREVNSEAVPQGVDWRPVDICVVHGQRVDDPWRTMAALFKSFPAEIEILFLFHSRGKPLTPEWVDNKVRQMNLSGDVAEKARQVLKKYRAYGLGDGSELVRNREIIGSYVEAARGRGDYEQALKEIRRFLLRPNPVERIALIRHKLGPRLFNGLAAEIDYVANCMSDGKTDQALHALRGLLEDYRREEDDGRLRLNSFAEWGGLLRLLIGGTLLPGTKGDAVHSAGGLVEEHQDELANDGFRRAWEDLILLAGLRPLDEEGTPNLLQLEPDEHSPIVRFLESLDQLACRLRPGAATTPATGEELMSLLGESMWTPLRERDWAAGGESVMSFPAWFRQLDATLDELLKHLPL